MKKSLLHTISILPQKLISVVFVLFIIHSSLFINHCSAQWVQQTLPVSGTPWDMVFFNANTGLISLNAGPPMLYRTTDGGSNWTFVNYIRIFNFCKIDSQTVYGNGRTVNVDDIIYRSFNKGLSWDSVSLTPVSYTDLSFISLDTGWICGHDGNFGAIWKTTNGGLTLSEELSSGTSGMDRIFFLRQKVNGEYTGWCSQGPAFRKTTNSGVNWTQVAPITASREIFFINKDTGWISNGGMFKCTDGGINWVNEPMPNDPSFVSTGMVKFVYTDNNILYGVGGIRFFSGGGGTDRGVIWKTTNGGLNWGYQQPDTAINIFTYNVIDFVDSLNGWAYNLNGSKGIHTTNGGGQIIFTGIDIISTEIPKDFKLYQNYPNPFNPETRIKFQISKTSQVKLTVSDILGREIAILVNEKLTMGSYETEFNGSNLSSGIYFYTLAIEKYTETKKMILIK